MTTVRKTITLTETQNPWINAQIESGAYPNDSEVLRDLIRKAQQEPSEIEIVRAAHFEAERSGLIARGIAEIRTAVKKRKSMNG
jgi:antitoxin ParD1/3/4